MYEERVPMAVAVSYLRATYHSELSELSEGALRTVGGHTKMDWRDVSHDRSQTRNLSHESQIDT